MMYDAPHFLVAGDSAMTVEFGDDISAETNARVLGVAYALETSALKGIVEVVPTYRSLMVVFDPLVARPAELVERIRLLEKSVGHFPMLPSRHFKIPVRYGGKFGPDLEFVARYNELRVDDVVRLHTSVGYTVFMMGFMPGFPYLGGMRREIATPRLETPRVKVPAGSIGIACEQTGIYPVESPGGWRIIGWTPVRLFEPLSEEAFLLRPGDSVEFFMSPVD